MILGVDPGVCGALATIEGSGITTTFDLPTYSAGEEGNRMQVDAVALSDLVSKVMGAKKAGRLVAFIERTHAPPGAHWTNRVQGKTEGIIESVLVLLGIEVFYVEPTQWQADLLGPGRPRRKKGQPKLTTRERAELRTQRLRLTLETARGMFPKMRARLELAQHTDRAAALLIAEWGRRRLEQEGGAP